MQKANSQSFLICIFESFFVTTRTQSMPRMLPSGIVNIKCFSYIIVAFMFLGLAQDTNAQGFSWLRSWRLPSDSPMIFYGVYSSYGQNTEYVNARSFSNVLDCCSFSDGTGNDMRMGITSEYWILGDFSLQGQLGYGTTSATFSSNREDSILIFDERTQTFCPRLLRRAYTLNSTIQSLELSLIAKKRLFSSHFSIAMGLTAAYTLPSIDMHQLELRIGFDSLSLPLEQELYTPAEMVKDINVSGMLIKPIFRLEYDQETVKEMYVKPYIQADITLNSRVTRVDPWRSLTILGGISLFFGL